MKNIPTTKWRTEGKNKKRMKVTENKNDKMNDKMNEIERKPNKTERRDVIKRKKTEK